VADPAPGPPGPAYPPDHPSRPGHAEHYSGAFPAAAPSHSSLGPVDRDSWGWAGWAGWAGSWPGEPAAPISYYCMGPAAPAPPAGLGWVGRGPYGGPGQRRDYYPPFPAAGWPLAGCAPPPGWPPAPAGPPSWAARPAAVEMGQGGLFAPSAAPVRLLRAGRLDARLLWPAYLPGAPPACGPGPGPTADRAGPEEPVAQRSAPEAAAAAAAAASNLTAAAAAAEDPKPVTVAAAASAPSG
jgi:hypothetical protein